MSKANCERGGCVDVFHASLLKNVAYCGEYDFPRIKEIHKIPRKMIPFSKALKEQRDYNQWVCFYEDDFLFERIWNCPSKYLEKLRKFEGVVSPDFSVYYDMPYSMQIWNIFRSRSIGAWLQKNGIHVIPNVRFGDERTFECVCDGISRHSVISIGSLGCIKSRDYREEFEKGVERVTEILEPETIVIYGTPPRNIDVLKEKGSNVVVIKPLSYFDRKKVNG